MADLKLFEELFRLSARSHGSTKPSLLTAEGKEIMNMLMNIFLDRGEDAKSRAVIFTNSRDKWNTDRSPDIVTDKLLPWIPSPHPGGAYRTILRALIQYLSKTAARRENYFPFRVEGFAFVGEEVAHFVFTAVDDDKLANLSTRYCKVLSPEQELYRTASEPALTNPTQCKCADAADSNVSGGSVENIFFTHSIKEVPPTTEERKTSEDDMRAIVFRFSGELEENLKNKMKIFLSRSVAEEHDAVIFTNDCSFWKEEEYLVIHDTEPMPPIPSSYDHERFEIAEDIRDYLHDLAKQQDCTPFHASALRVGNKKFAMVHLLFSRYSERLTKYARNLRTERADMKRITGLERYKRKRDVVAKMKQCDGTGIGVAPVLLRDLESRLGPEMTRKLDEKIEVYLNLNEEGRAVTTIFTNREDLWFSFSEESSIVVKESLPPFPFSYQFSHDFDMVQDVVDYVARKISEKRLEPGTVSTLQFGDEDYEEIHLVVTPFLRLAIKHLYYSIPEYEYLPSTQITPNTVMVERVYHHDRENKMIRPLKKNLFVKHRVRTFPIWGYQRSGYKAPTRGAEPAEGEPSSYRALTPDKMDNA